MTTDIIITHQEQEQPANDCIKSPEMLAKEINTLHEEQEQAEQVSAMLAWEIGVRLNLAYETIRKTKWGLWGSFLDEHCPEISRMTVWRYRAIARFYTTVLQFDGMTLSQMYVEMKLATFQDEGDDGEEKPPGERKAEESHTVKMFKELVKASKKFDVPASLSSGDKALMKKCAKVLVLTLADASKKEKVIDAVTVTTPAH